jgi:Transcriptional regulator, AbiEi antitoxin
LTGQHVVPESLSKSEDLVPQLSRSLAAQAARSHGIVRVEQLVADGVGLNSIRRLVRRGSLIRVHHGVLRVATSPDTFEARCVAACFADPDVVVSGVAAASLWKFHHVFRTDVPVLLIPHDRTPVTRGVILRRTNVLPDSHVVHRRDGIRVASPPRAWFDCARDLDDERFERLTEWVLDHHTSTPTLWTMTRVLTQRGRPGLARVQRVMTQRSDWQRPAGSGLELRVLKALESRGVGPLVRQFALRLPNGTVIHPDGADPDAKWAVEVDHVTWHGGRFDAQRDKGRDRNARRIGWQVERVTDQELSTNFGAAIDELVELWTIRSTGRSAA